MFYNKKIYSVLDEIYARRKTVNIYILKFKEFLNKKMYIAR